MFEPPQWKPQPLHKLEERQLLCGCAVIRVKDAHQVFENWARLGSIASRGVGIGNSREVNRSGHGGERQWAKVTFMNILGCLDACVGRTY